MKITKDMLSNRLANVMASHISDTEKMEILGLNGVSRDVDEPAVWHKEGKSAWAIFLDENNKLHVETAPLSEVSPALLDEN